MLGIATTWLLGGASPSPEESLSPVPFSGVKSDWNGYDRYEFTFDGRTCYVVTPQRVAPGMPWIWRARFWGHEPQTDLALLERGFHLVYIDVAGMFGSPRAVAHWNAFYDYLTKEHGLAAKPALEGMSRGGLIVYNWAAANPDKVACIYADAPVCDIKSWPGGLLGKGTGNAGEWPLCLQEYGLTEETVLAFKGNPIDHLDPIAQARIPLLHVCGGADDGVPVDENTRVLEERYKALGGPIRVIIKPGCGHHPHSLKDPAVIVQFILRHTVGVSEYVQVRDGLRNCRRRFAEEKRGRVAFLGGSITEMQGWRDIVCQDLVRRFPGTEFDFVEAGIASTDTSLAPFRLDSDVFSRGPVDLLFVEFAVNDDTNGRTPVESVRGMEGIIRQARCRNPAIDLVIQHFVDPGKMEVIGAGQVPDEIQAHEQVADYYGVPSINQAHRVTDETKAGEYDWETFGGIHPAPFGHAIYAHTVSELLDFAWRDAVGETDRIVAHAMPDAPLDPLNYGRGRYIPLTEATLETGWTLVPQWDAADGENRARFKGIPVIEAVEPGATLRLSFDGTAIGLYVLAGPDVGVLEFSVDGGAWHSVDQFTQWSSGLHIPWSYLLDAALPVGTHEVVVRTTDVKNEASNGYAARIVQFLAN